MAERSGTVVLDPEQRRLSILANIAGNAVEWFDFAIYGAFALTIGRVFFPSDDPTTSLLASFGTFAAGFLARPFGGLVFGQIGDRIGRRWALLLSVGMMSIPTLLLGLLPGYETLGIAAPAILIGLRILQGLSAGGEYITSIVYLAESAPPRSRALASSWSIFGSVVGALAGSALAALLTEALSPEQLESYGWRIAFLAGFAMALLGLLLRRALPDIEAETESEDSKGLPIVQALRRHFGDVMRVVGLNLAYGIVWYITFVYVVSWLTDRVGEPQSEAHTINTVSMIAMLLLTPVMAALSDRFGRRPFLLFGAGALAVAAWPAFWLMDHPNVAMILAGELLLVTLLAFYTSSMPAVFAELFPSAVRITAVGAGYNLSAALFGGMVPLVATWLVGTTGDDLSIAWLLSAACLISFLVALKVPESAFTPLPD